MHLWIRLPSSWEVASLSSQIHSPTLSAFAEEDAQKSAHAEARCRRHHWTQEGYSGPATFH